MSDTDNAVSTNMPSERDALKQKTMAVKEAVVDLASEARRFAGHRMSEVKDHASGLAQSARDRAGDANEQVIGFVRENPYKSVAIAAGIGFLAGVLIKRRW